MVNNESTPSGSTSAPNNESIQTLTSERTPNAAGTSQYTVERQGGEDTFAREAVKQIEPIIESFRTHKIKKPQAICQIGEILTAEPSGNDQLKLDALEQYAGTLD